MNALLYRPLHTAAMLFLIFLAASLGAIGWLNWRTLQGLDGIKAAVEHVHDIQGVGLRLTRLLGEAVSGERVVDEAAVATLRDDLTHFLNPTANLSPVSTSGFRTALDALSEPGVEPKLRLVRAQNALREATYQESGAESLLLENIRNDARTQATLVVAGLALLPALFALGVWLLRQRVFRSLGDLHALLSRLASGNFSTVDTAGLDAMVLPLFNNYNRVVGRLEELERAHLRRAVTLESEVRSATRALMEQQQSLARAERMAALGELSAAVAHELRNPLAGIQMALANLRQDVGEGEPQRRLDGAIEELQRVARLLSGLLTHGRQLPEPAQPIDLAHIVQQLLEITRYRTPPQVDLVPHVEAGTQCRLPPDQLRQALLNLVLNAIEACRTKGGQVAVGARIQDQRLHLQVTDEGPGFPRELLGNGVRAFYSAGEGGTGLGLAIVQRFARDRGGELRLSNPPGGGACAELVLPCAHV